MFVECSPGISSVALPGISGTGERARSTLRPFALWTVALGGFEDAKLTVLQPVNARIARDLQNLLAALRAPPLLRPSFLALLVQCLLARRGLGIGALQIHQIGRYFFPVAAFDAVILHAVAFDLVLANQLKTAVFQIQLEVRGRERENEYRAATNNSLRMGGL